MPTAGAIAALLLIAGQCLAAVPDARIYELIRELKQPPATNFLREWLICGEFPNPPHPGQRVYDHTPPCVGFETDYLAEHGGETGIHPVEGMTHTLEDGSTREWRSYVSGGDVVDLLKAHPGRTTENRLAYAFRAVTLERGGRHYLAVGSDDGVQVWVNGERVHDHLVARGVKVDQDLVLVDMRRGENTILLKVENGGGGWGFSCRLIEEAALAGDKLPFQPKIESKVGEDLLLVQPNAAFATPSRGPGSVIVEVVRPGGIVIARASAPGGKRLALPTADWPEGPYEIRCLMDAGLGRRRAVHLPWFKGDPAAAGARLVEAADNADGQTPEGMLVKLLLALARDRAGDPKRLNADSVIKCHSALMEFEELLLDRAGETGAARPYGFVRLAYRDPVDGAPQFCRAYLPAGYSTDREWPMVIHLHGYNPDNPPYVKWENVDSRHHKWAEEYGVIVLEPHGRYNSWYKGLGDADVLRCIALAKQRFAVDEERVCLTGASMGGGGVWEIGTRHPELFAGIAPVYGGWDDRIFASKAEIDALTRRQQFEAASYSSFARAESLLTTPVFVNQGTADENVDVNQARLAVRMMQRWGYPVRYWEHKGVAHEYDKLGHEDAMLRWFLRQRRVRAPRKVRLRAPELKSASAHWVRVESCGDPLGFIQVDAEVIAPNCLRLRTENVLAVTLSPPEELVDRNQALRVDWNGYGLPAQRLGAHGATFLAPNYVPGQLAKRPALAGPLRDVLTTPFALVVGTTSADARMRAFCARRAGRIADRWQLDQHHRPRVFNDVDLAEGDLQSLSLVLIGGPNENAVTKELIGELPLRIAGDRIEIDGAAFDCPDSLLRMVYPHPRNRARYVAVTAATSVDAMGYYALSHDPLGDCLLGGVDFYVIDGRAPDPAHGRPDEAVCVVSGFFDHNWRYSEKLVIRGDEAIRTEAPKERAPRYASPPTDVAVLYLSDLLELTTSAGFDHLARDLSFGRQPLRLGEQAYAKGLGLSVWRHWEKKSAIEWTIEGGPWNRLRGVVGLQLKPDAKSLPKKLKDDTKVKCFVKGDGKEKFKTGQLKWNSPPVPLDVPLEGVKRLRLEVVNEGGLNVAAQSVNWAEVRLEVVAPATEGAPGGR